MLNNFAYTELISGHPARAHEVGQRLVAYAAAEGFEGMASLQEGARLRRVRVVRDYGMFDRREAPQFYPDAPGRPTLHS